MKKLLYFILGLVLLLVIAWFVFLNLPKASFKNKAADFNIEANAFYHEFETNEKKSNTKYTGKTIEVSGTIAEISTDKQSATVVMLESDNPMNGIMCTLEGKPSKELQIGQKISIKGLCTGYLMGVIMNKCTITQYQ